MLTNEQKEAIKGLREMGFDDLYVVDCYISNEVACTYLWNIYADLKDAMNWIDSCELVHTGHITKTDSCERKFTHKDGNHNVEQRFVLTKVA